MPPIPLNPSITTWMRLEPHSRNATMETGLQARIYDPLWMLARQWQVGEFNGADNGSPVVARWRAESARLTRYYAGAIAPNTRANAPQFDGRIMPLETLVERETVRPPADPAAAPQQLRLAAEAGRHFLRVLALEPVSNDYSGAFISRYSFPALTDEQRAAFDDESIAFCDLVAARVPDGRLLFAAFQTTSGGEIVIAPELQVAAADLAEVQKAARLWLEWYTTLFSEPDPSAVTWAPERMEYAFSVGTRLGDGERILTAQEYDGGRLDWYDFYSNPEVTLGGASDAAFTSIARTIIPAPVSYRGMPAARFWQFEDAQVDFGSVDAGPTDLVRMLLVEFSLVYGNDWFVLPIELDVGSVCRTLSLVITDTFGIQTLVKPGSESGLPNSLWRMFQLAYTRSSGIATPASNMFFLPPALVGSLQGDPVEEVLFLRDEMANLAWAVERLVESPSGGVLNRFEAYLAQQGSGSDPAALPAVPAGTRRYLLSTTVPDYWVPLLPVNVGRGLRLQRGAVLKTDGSKGSVSALGRILEPGQPLSLFEEEIPREGIRVTRSYRFTRWIDGSAYLWVGRDKSVGRGEGSSGLRFDSLNGSAAHIQQT